MIADALIQNSTLRSLEICGNKFGVNGVTVILNAMKINSTLKVLSFDQNAIGMVADNVILDALQYNPTIIVYPMPYEQKHRIKESKKININNHDILRSLLDKLIGEDGGIMLSFEFQMRFPAFLF